MDDQAMSLPRILQYQFHVLCGADRSVFDKELEMFSQYERRVNEENPDIIAFPQSMPLTEYPGRPPAGAQRRKAA